MGASSETSSYAIEQAERPNSANHSRVLPEEFVADYSIMSKKQNLGCFFVGAEAGPRSQRGSRLLSSSENLPDHELPPEVEEGNVEYKLKLVNPNPTRIEHLVTQMKWRLREGLGEAVYEIGVTDKGLLTGVTRDDMDSSIETLRYMANICGADILVLKEFGVAGGKAVFETTNKISPFYPKVAWTDNGDTVAEEDQSIGFVAEVLIRKTHEEDFELTDIRIAMLGNTDAGKSTLCGVLTYGELDNGSGKARLNLFRHLHEIQSGHTSSISREIMGFDDSGRMFNYENHNIESILDNSSKIVTFIDLAGSQKYFKTTVFGLTGFNPDYAALVVNAKKGPVGSFREHLGLTVALGILSFVCITKIDGTSQSLIKRSKQHLEMLAKSSAVRRPVLVVNNLKDAEEAAEKINDRTPVFTVSSVTGENLALLQHFLSQLKPALSLTESLEAFKAPPRFNVDGVLDIKETGTVLTGLVTKGIIREEDELYIGPFEDKTYHPVRIASIHCNRLPRRLAKCGQTVSLAFHNLEKIPRKGMILQSKAYDMYYVDEFKADITILQTVSASKIKVGFQATVFIDNIRQKIQIVDMKREVTTGETTEVTFKLLQFPDVVYEGAVLFFRNGRTKGWGTVKSVGKIPAALSYDGEGLTSMNLS